MPISIHNRIKKSLIEWDELFYIDYWWRKKYKIPFGSSQHKEMSLIDMKIEYEEEKELEYLSLKIKQREIDKQSYNITGKFLKKSEEEQLTKDEIDELFDNIDISAFNKQPKPKSP